MPIVNWGTSTRNRMERRYLKSKISFKIPKISKMDPKKNPLSNNQSPSPNPMDQYYYTRNPNPGLGPGFTPPWAHPPNLIPIPRHGSPGYGSPRKRKKSEEFTKYDSAINFEETQVISNLENKNSELRSLCKKYESRISDLVQNSSKEKSGFQLQISNFEKEISDLKKSIPIEENETTDSKCSSENNEKTLVQVNQIRVHYTVG